MDIKTQIQQEAEKRSTVTVHGAKPWEQINHSKRKALKDFGEWLDTEIVQPLRKENEGLKTDVLFWKVNGENVIASLQSQLSLSEGRVERITKLFESFYKEMAIGGSVLSDRRIDVSWQKFKTEHNL